MADLPGATRAFPAGHPALHGTPFVGTGHPILLPGNPTAGSVIMAAEKGAQKSAYSVNHGAGRCMGRKAADRALDQKTVDDEFTANDILTNCRQYPKDEAPAAYKNFDAVLDSVKQAGLASEVAPLRDQRFRHKSERSGLRRESSLVRNVQQFWRAGGLGKLAIAGCYYRQKVDATNKTVLRQVHAARKRKPK